MRTIRGRRHLGQLLIGFPLLTLLTGSLTDRVHAQGSGAPAESLDPRLLSAQELEIRRNVVGLEQRWLEGQFESRVRDSLLTQSLRAHLASTNRLNRSLDRLLARMPAPPPYDSTRPDTGGKGRLAILFDHRALGVYFVTIAMPRAILAAGDGPLTITVTQVEEDGPQRSNFWAATRKNAVDTYELLVADSSLQVDSLTFIALGVPATPGLSGKDIAIEPPPAISSLGETRYELVASDAKAGKIQVAFRDVLVLPDSSPRAAARSYEIVIGDRHWLWQWWARVVRGFDPPTTASFTLACIAILAAGLRDATKESIKSFFKLGRSSRQPAPATGTSPD